GVDRRRVVAAGVQREGTSRARVVDDGAGTGASFDVIRGGLEAPRVEDGDGVRARLAGETAAERRCERDPPDTARVGHVSEPAVVLEVDDGQAGRVRDEEPARRGIHGELAGWAAVTEIDRADEVIPRIVRSGVRSSRADGGGEEEDDADARRVRGHEAS